MAGGKQHCGCPLSQTHEKALVGAAQFVGSSRLARQEAED